jgi:hypothetical protein
MCKLFYETGDVHLTNMKVGFLALCLSAAPCVASAQTMQWTDKGYITVNGGAQVGSHNLDTSSTFPLYDETASVSSTQEIKGGGFFDIGGAYRVWGKNLLAGVSYSHTSSDATVELTASIPDPVFFDRPRTVNSSQDGAKHTENSVHLDVIWMMPIANKLDIGFFGGPSIISVKQDTITTLTVTEPGPVVNAPLTEVSKTTVGINVGLDVQYLVATKIAVGGLARYTWGSAEIEGATEKLTVGGFQIGGGIRFRF